ncbi:hypothetical protein ACFX2B_036848 [Malus domestica]
MISPFIRKLGGESGREYSIIVSGRGGGYNKISSDDSGDQQSNASGNDGGDDEINNDDGDSEQGDDEVDVPKPPTFSIRSTWVELPNGPLVCQSF